MTNGYVRGAYLLVLLPCGMIDCVHRPLGPQEARSLCPTRRIPGVQVSRRTSSGPFIIADIMRILSQRGWPMSVLQRTAPARVCALDAVWYTQDVAFVPGQ